MSSCLGRVAVAITCPKCNAEVEISTNERAPEHIGYGIHDMTPIVKSCREFKAAPLGTDPKWFKCKALDKAILAVINP